MYWIEWSYSASNHLQGDVISALSEPVISNNSFIIAVTGPYKTQQAAQAKLQAMAGMSAPSGFSALQQEVGSLPTALNAASQVGPSLPTGLAAIGDFFSRLTEASTWERVGLAVAGLILLDVGLKSFTGTSVTEAAFKRTPPGRIAGVLK